MRAREGSGVNGRQSVELDVRVPRQATIVVDTASGDVSGEDLTGEQRFSTASGDVELMRISGSADIEATSGDVELAATGVLRLKARTVSGDLTVRAGSLAELSVTTTSGDIAIAGELAPDATHVVETVSGDAVLALEGGTRFDVSTVTGNVSTGVPHRSERTDGRRLIVVGDGRATLRVRTMSGDVHIANVRARDGGVAPAAAAAASPPAAAIAAAYDDARLAILRSLERGEINVAEASRRLEALDTAGVAEEDARG